MKSKSTSLIALSVIARISHALPRPHEPIVFSNPATDPGAVGQSQGQNANPDRVVCNFYEDTSKNNLDVCTPFCGQIKDHDSKYASVSCDASSSAAPGEHVEKMTDENGDEYTPGICKCDMPILDEIFFGTLDAVLELASLAIPGVGELAAADAGMQVAVKTAVKMADAGQDGLDFLSMFGGPCQSFNYSCQLTIFSSHSLERGSQGEGLRKNPDGSVPNTPPPGRDKNPDGTDRSTDPNKNPDGSERNKANNDQAKAACGADNNDRDKNKRPPKQRRADHANYVAPSCRETQNMLAQLSSYDLPGGVDTTNNIVNDYMRTSNTAKDSSTFYMGGTSDSAAMQKNINGEQTVASVYWGYGEGPFNPALEPFKSIMADKRKYKFSFNWFRATSRAFARITSGKVYVVSDDKD